MATTPAADINAAAVPEMKAATMGAAMEATYAKEWKKLESKNGEGYNKKHLEDFMKALDEAAAHEGNVDSSVEEDSEDPSVTPTASAPAAP